MKSYVLREGGSVGSMVVVGGAVVGATVETGLASGGKKLQSSSHQALNSMSSTATYPFALFVRVTINLN